MQNLKKQQSIIENAYQNRQSPDTFKDKNIKQTISEVINLLDQGQIRIAEMNDGQWAVNQWVKQAVLLFFRVNENELIDHQVLKYFDKVPLKFTDFTAEDFKTQGARIVPTACIRKGAYIAKDVILMPSYVNIGAYIDTGTLIDTWATVGSCAQIGKNVHISGGVGIGGVLEPLQANPTIIEDNCFIGARSEIVEGVIIEKGSVLSMGVFIGQSTPIYDRASGEIYYGRVPENSVVVPGTLPSKDGKYNLYAAIIVKQVDDKTRSKTTVNELLRSVKYD